MHGSSLSEANLPAPAAQSRALSIDYSYFMERICTQCHAVLAQETQADWCPACGGTLLERTQLLPASPSAAPEVDHRGIVLPRRHALGGIITPQ
jgi:predicted RNA-binding Zn-ribbon protein involved in translation (DUF1610 family)